MKRIQVTCSTRSGHKPTARVKLLAVVVATSSLVACQQQPGQDFMGNQTTSSSGSVSKQTMGTIGGAVIGGVLGSKVGKGTGRGVAIGAGTLLGALAGSSIGASLDRADMQYYNQASQRAFESGPAGQSFPWSNPQSGNSGSVTPYNYYETAEGYCREYSQTISVGGQIQKGYGRACRQQDGTWQIVQ